MTDQWLSVINRRSISLLEPALHMGVSTYRTTRAVSLPERQISHIWGRFPFGVKGSAHKAGKLPFRSNQPWLSFGLKQMDPQNETLAIQFPPPGSFHHVRPSEIRVQSHTGTTPLAPPHNCQTTTFCLFTYRQVPLRMEKWQFLDNLADNKKIGDSQAMENQIHQPSPVSYQGIPTVCCTFKK